MITNEKYDEVLDSGLLLDHYFVLDYICKGIPLSKNKRIQGFINLLSKKGQLEEGKPTKKAERLVGKVQIMIKTGDISVFSKELHQKCKDKLEKLTGKPQVIDKINNKPYSFLPNAVDLQRTLVRFVKEYKVYDFEKIEKAILSYIERCNDARSWFPVLQYYIMKNSQSPLMTDIESDNNQEPVNFKSSQQLL